MAVAANSFLRSLKATKQKQQAESPGPATVPWNLGTIKRSEGLWAFKTSAASGDKSEDPRFSSEHHLLGEEIGVGKCCDAGDLLSLYASDFPVQPASLIQTHQNSQALFTKVASVALGIANSLKPTGTEPFPCSVKIPGTSTVSTSIAAVLCLAAFLYGYG